MAYFWTLFHFSRDSFSKNSYTFKISIWEFYIIQQLFSPEKFVLQYSGCVGSKFLFFLKGGGICFEYLQRSYLALEWKENQKWYKSKPNKWEIDAGSHKGAGFRSIDGVIIVNCIHTWQIDESGVHVPHPCSVSLLMGHFSLVTPSQVTRYSEPISYWLISGALLIVLSQDNWISHTWKTNIFVKY